MHHQVKSLSTRLKYFLFNLGKIGGPIHPRSSDHLTPFTFFNISRIPYTSIEHGNQFKNKKAKNDKITDSFLLFSKTVM